MNMKFSLYKFGSGCYNNHQTASSFGKHFIFVKPFTKKGMTDSMKTKRSAPTMKDVAQEAGVALGTVSKVFNGLPVGESYKHRVEEAAKKLGYQVNNYARGLRANRTNTVAVILPSVTHPFFGALAEYTCRALRKKGRRTLLATTDLDQDVEQECVNMVQQNKVDGIIALTYNPALQFNEEIPFVSIDRPFSPSVPCVSSDNYGGGQLAARKLVELGCKRLLLLQETAATPGEVDKRRQGFRDWCTANGVAHECVHIYESTDHWGDFWRFLEAHMKPEAPEYDGIFCGTDHLAYNVCKKLHALGVRVPQDVQVIGYDGLRFFAGDDYYCSSIAQPVEQMAETAVELLLAPDRSKLPTLVCLPVRYQPGGTTMDSLETGGVCTWQANT